MVLARAWLRSIVRIQRTCGVVWQVRGGGVVGAVERCGTRCNVGLMYG